jgi:hypothetical protein
MFIIKGKRFLIDYYSRCGLTKCVIDVLHSKIMSDLFKSSIKMHYIDVFRYCCSIFHALAGDLESYQVFPDFSDSNMIFITDLV